MSQVDKNQLLQSYGDLWSIEHRLKGLAAPLEHITEDSCFTPEELLGLGLTIKGLAREVSEFNKTLSGLISTPSCKRGRDDLQ